MHCPSRLVKIIIFFSFSPFSEVLIFFDVFVPCGRIFRSLDITVVTLEVEVFGIFDVFSFRELYMNMKMRIAVLMKFF